MATLIDDLEITALAFGGNGVGRHEGKAVFVPDSAPGDRVRCRVEREHKRHTEATIEALLTAAPERRPPPCPVAGLCGGCQWQHLPYTSQVIWKDRIFRDILTRQGKVAGEGVQPLVAAPAELGYRSRAQFKCRQTADGVVAGFYRRGSHFVVDIASCPIADPRLNQLLAQFRAWLAASPCPDRVPQLDLGVADAGGLRAVVHCLPGAASVLAAYLKPLATAAGISLFVQSGRKEFLVKVVGEEDLFIHCGTPPVELAYGPGGFAQVNLAQNRALVEAVLAAAGLSGREQVLDLYCGMGNFSLPLAGRAAQVVGVEDFAPSIAKATANARRNGIANAHFLTRPAEGALTDLSPAAGFDLVLLDPPRTGAYAVMPELVRCRPRRILYVSCDPTTLARDLQPLLHGGYRLCWSRPYDFFPQTHHIESLTVLELDGAP